MLETEAHRLRQDNETLVQEHQRCLERLRHELESERQGRQELEAGRSQTERDRDTLRANPSGSGPSMGTRTVRPMRWRRSETGSTGNWRRPKLVEPRPAATGMS